jgi:hypothetical protein
LSRGFLALPVVADIFGKSRTEPRYPPLYRYSRAVNFIVTGTGMYHSFMDGHGPLPVPLQLPIRTGNVCFFGLRVLRQCAASNSWSHPRFKTVRLYTLFLAGNVDRIENTTDMRSHARASMNRIRSELGEAHHARASINRIRSELGEAHHARASINRIRSELGEAQASDNVHALQLVKDEFTCVRNLD